MTTYSCYRWINDLSQKIPMIKQFRELTGVGLKEAKDAVEFYLGCFSDGIAIPADKLGNVHSTEGWAFMETVTGSLEAHDVSTGNRYVVPSIFTDQYKIDRANELLAYYRQAAEAQAEKLNQYRVQSDVTRVLAGIAQVALENGLIDFKVQEGLETLLAKVIHNNEIDPIRPDRVVEFRVPPYSWNFRNPVGQE